MSENFTCPRCGRPLPADAAGRLCPACALEAALNLTPSPLRRKSTGHARLRRKRLLHYQLLEKIGEGGMGVVYKARDTRLDRLVAIKVLPSDKVDDPERRRRFIAEAKAASALNHPNIVTIHEVAAAAGVHFIVMEYVEGRTLDNLIGPRGLSPEQVLLYAIPVAGALARAHEAGIIHRDLKPQNIMVRDDGLVKLLDFGLAKLVEAEARTEDSAEFGVPSSDGPTPAKHRQKPGLQIQTAALTEASRIMGTPGFMAPEQIEGRKIDGRVDLFAFGAVLYHALSGRRPFARATVDETCAAILREEPAALENEPSPLVAIVTRCLRKTPEDRFQTAAELLAALRAVSTGPAAETPEPSIAVLPFANLGDRPEDSCFGDALSGEIITTLARLPGLKVIGRTSSATVAAARLEPREIGTRLGVAHLLEGSVQRAEKTLRVAARLLRAEDGQCLWAETYDRAPADVFAIQEEIAQTVSRHLKIQSGTNGPLVARPTENLEAYHHYLLGVSELQLVGERHLLAAREELQQTIRLDPDFTAAHNALAEIWWYLGYWGFVAPREALLHGVWCVMRALALNDRLGETHALMAMYRANTDYNWAETRREIQRALELDPQSPKVRLVHAFWGLLPAGRVEECRQELEALLEADPLNNIVRAHLVALFQGVGQHEAAIEQCRRIIQNEPRYPISYGLMSLSLEWTGKRAEALAVAERVAEITRGSHQPLGRLGWLYGRAGRTEEAERCLAQLHEFARTRYVPPHLFVFVLIGLGRIDEAVQWLDRAIEDRDPLATYLKGWPMYEPVRAHPRYPELLRKMNMEP
jgi:eukaryotic-like serine/threonine-protein kinase